MKQAVRILTIGALALAIASCGGRQPLKPLKGQAGPAVPVGATEKPTAAELTTPSIQARPERSVELLRQSDQRKDDPFDLPPEGGKK
jgi:hypothetical protein